MNSATYPIKFVQMTDIHLHSDMDDTLLGMSTSMSFDLVLQEFSKNDPDTEFIILSGDLIQDYLPNTYKVLAKKFKLLQMPVYWLPGNHDTESLYSGTFSGPNIKDDKIIDLGDWEIILLNSVIWGKVHGHLADEQLEFLQTTLRNAGDKHVMVFMHHHPVVVNCSWLDGSYLRNSSEFWDIIDKFNNIKAVVWGHIHQEVDIIRNNLRLLATPSTCIQFKPQSQTFTIDPVNPGYRIFELQADGHFTTKIHRLSHFDYDFSSSASATGY